MTILSGLLALAVAIHRGRLQDTLQGTATLVVTGAAGVRAIERPSANRPLQHPPSRSRWRCTGSDELNDRRL